MNNWKIHFGWTVALGILLLISVITFWLGGKGNEMVSYVSFASALISIILALVAIFYSMSQNTSSQQNIGEMKTLIEQASALMAEKAGAMTDEAKAIREIGRTISDKFQPVVGGESKPLEGHLFQFNISRSGSSFLLVLHCMVKSYERRKRILPEEIVMQINKEDKLDSVANFAIATMAFSVITVLGYFFEDGSIVRHERPDNRLPEIEVKNLPANFSEYVSKEIKKRIKEHSTTEETKPTFEESIQAIDDYFKS